MRSEILPDAADIFDAVVSARPMAYVASFSALKAALVEGFAS
jgi:hypothetical protein